MAVGDCGLATHVVRVLVGTFFRRAADHPDVLVSRVRFPGAEEYGLGEADPISY